MAPAMTKVWAWTVQRFRVHSRAGQVCILSRTPLSGEYGRYKTVKARFWPWLAGESPQTLSSCPLFVRKRVHAEDAWSGDTTPCKVTPVILHGVCKVTPVILHGVFKVTPVMLHGVVSPDAVSIERRRSTRRGGSGAGTSLIRKRPPPRITIGA